MRTDEWQVIPWTTPNDYAILHSKIFCRPHEYSNIHGGTFIQHSADTKKCRICSKPIPEHIILQWKLIYDGT